MGALYKEGTYVLLDLDLEERLAPARVEALRYPSGNTEGDPSSIDISVFEEDGEQRLERTNLSLSDYKKAHQADALSVQTITAEDKKNDTTLRVARVMFQTPDGQTFPMTLKLVL